MVGNSLISRMVSEVISSIAAGMITMLNHSNEEKHTFFYLGPATLRDYGTEADKGRCRIAPAASQFCNC